MKQTVSDGLFIIELNDYDSTFIRQILYDARNEHLSVVLKGDSVYNYAQVPLETFIEFSTCNSFGSFYNSNIKQKFPTMANEKSNSSNQPTRINKAGNHKRYIRMSLDVKKINKDWLYVAESGAVYLKATLVMLPDGTIDQYGQLGFVAQEVPKEVYQNDKKAKGEILGNAEEIEWKKDEEKVKLIDKVNDSEVLDDLPF